MVVLKCIVSTRQIVDEVGISNSSAYYVLTAMIERGFVKLANFKNNVGKGQYCYMLISKGIREKSLLTHPFIKRKVQEFEGLWVEIEARKEAGIVGKAIAAPKVNK